MFEESKGGGISGTGSIKFAINSDCPDDIKQKLYDKCVGGLKSVEHSDLRDLSSDKVLASSGLSSDKILASSSDKVLASCNSPKGSYIPEEGFIEYIDANSLYAWAMRLPLPI